MTVKEFKEMVKKINAEYDDYEIVVYEKGSVYTNSPIAGFVEHPYDKRNGFKKLTLHVG